MTRGMNARTWASVAAMVATLAGCSAQPRWEHPSLSRDQWVRDEAACRRWAAAEVEREVGRETAARGDPTVTRDDALAAGMARVEGVRRERELRARCMSERGYRPAKDG